MRLLMMEPSQLPRRLRVSRPQLKRNPYSIDDSWAEIALQVPGGWGSFIQVNGQPTICLYIVQVSTASGLYFTDMMRRGTACSTASIRMRWDGLRRSCKP